MELQLNRHRKTGHKGRIVMEELALDEEGHMFYVNDHPIALTKQEFSIIGLFMKHPDKIYSKQELYELAREEYYIGEDKTINVHISNIRKKIGEYSEKDYIDTVWGIGYRLKRFNR